MSEEQIKMIKATHILKPSEIGAIDCTQHGFLEILKQLSGWRWRLATLIFHDTVRVRVGKAATSLDRQANERHQKSGRVGRQHPGNSH